MSRRRVEWQSSVPYLCPKESQSNKTVVKLLSQTNPVEKLNSLVPQIVMFTGHVGENAALLVRGRPCATFDWNAQFRSSRKTPCIKITAQLITRFGCLFHAGLTQILYESRYVVEIRPAKATSSSRFGGWHKFRQPVAIILLVAVNILEENTLTLCTASACLVLENPVILSLETL